MESRQGDAFVYYSIPSAKRIASIPIKLLPAMVFTMNVFDSGHAIYVDDKHVSLWNLHEKIPLCQIGDVNSDYYYDCIFMPTRGGLMVLTLLSIVVFSFKDGLMQLDKNWEGVGFNVTSWDEHRIVVLNEEPSQLTFINLETNSIEKIVSLEHFNMRIQKIHKLAHEWLLMKVDHVPVLYNVVTGQLVQAWHETVNNITVVAPGRIAYRIDFNMVLQEMQLLLISPKPFFIARKNQYSDICFVFE